MLSGKVFATLSLPEHTHQRGEMDMRKYTINSATPAGSPTAFL
jgi:hypothetical protein